MMPGASLAALKDSSWSEYLTRFALGGAATVFAGLISSAFGPSIGGLFLALPAIFCASATLIEKHEQRRKRERGFKGQRRGQEAAALDAAGAALGSIGLIAFALSFASLCEHHPVGAFFVASLAWILVSMLAWWTWHHIR